MERLKIIEIQDIYGEWHIWYLDIQDSYIAYGGVCNVGLLEENRIMRQDYASLDDTLQELVETLTNSVNNN